MSDFSRQRDRVSMLDVKLGEEIYHSWSCEKIGVEDVAQCETLRASLEQIIAHEWPGQGLELRIFGSRLTGLGTKNSDIDMCLVDPSRPLGLWTKEEECKAVGPDIPYTYVQYGRQRLHLPIWYDVETLSDLFARGNNVLSSEAVHAIVPIVKLQVRTGGQTREVDISVNNLFGLKNSSLLSQYVSLRLNTLPILYFGVRKWFKNRGLNDSTGTQTGTRTMSSYAIVLLVIQFLQGGYELPNLQEPYLLNIASEHKSNQLPRIPDGFETSKSTFNNPGADRNKQSTYWNTSVIEPLGDHKDVFSMYKSPDTRLRIITEKNYFESRPCPNIQKWFQTDVECAKHIDRDRNPQWKYLPIIEQLGVHQTDPYKDRIDLGDIGRLFLEFIDWIHDDVLIGSSHTLVDIRAESGCLQKVNTLQSEWEYKKWLRHRRKDDNMAPDFDPDQPTEWMEKDLVIVDPFIRHRNVIQGVRFKGIDFVKYEVRRARNLYDRFGTSFSFRNLIAPR
ncbi:unnamed protein product [Sympodiomycopsis kandeliae]